MPVVSFVAGGPSVASAAFSCVSLPRNCPNTCTDGPPGPAARRQSEPSASGCVRRPGEEAREHLLDLRPRPGGDEVRALRDGMRAEGEARDDPEVAAAATAAGPVEVAVVLRVGDEDLPVGGDDLDGDEVVGGEPPGARGEPEAAAERVAADPDAGAGAGGDREPVRAERVVDVAEPRSRADDACFATTRTLASFERSTTTPGVVE